MSGDVPRTYVSGERVFGPPIGTFDVEWVAREVARRSHEDDATAHRWVEAAWQVARAQASIDAPVLLAHLGALGADDALADLVVEQVRGYCAAYEVDPAER